MNYNIEEIKEDIESIYQLCDKVANKFYLPINVKEYTKYDIFHFLMYLSKTDTPCNNLEAHFINEFCNIGFTPKQIDFLIIEKNIGSEEFENNPLIGISIIIQVANILTKLEDSKIIASCAQNLIKSYFGCFLSLAKEFILYTKKDKEIKIQKLKRYINIMLSYTESELRKKDIEITILPIDDVVDKEFKKIRYEKDVIQQYLLDLSYELQNINEEICDLRYKFNQYVEKKCAEEEIDNYNINKDYYDCEYLINHIEKTLPAYPYLLYENYLYETSDSTYQIYCPYCNKKISYKERYCPRCGNLINSYRKYKVIINGYSGSDEAVQFCLNEIYKTNLLNEEIENIFQNCPYNFREYNNFDDSYFCARKLLRYGIDVSIINPDGQIEFSDTGTIICPNCGSINVRILSNKNNKTLTNFWVKKKKRLCTICQKIF